MSVHYERLSSLDNSFLALESRSTHMHVGAVTIFSAGSFAMPEGGIDVERLKDFISSKLHMIPRYRQRIVRVPIEQHPVWVDDEHFNIDYHIRHIAVPRPGTDEELKRIAGRLMSQQIDRTKPMWEMVVVEGLEDGRFAIVTKIHHCMIDGLSGVDLMAVLMSLVPSEEIVPGPAYEPRPIPNGTELLVRETTRRITGSIGALRSARDVVGNVSDLFDSASNRLRAVGASLSAGWLVPTGKTPINGDIGPGRRFSWVDMPLTDVKAIKNKLGGTVNDVFLATVAGAVRAFLLDQRNVDVADVDGIDFRVMAPVSVRGVDQNGTLGNQVAMWLAPLPVGEPDPISRLAIVRAETERLKETNQALGAATLVRVSTGAPATLVALGARLAANARPFNMTVTNVPGPQFPLYMLDARMEASYPLVPLWESHGVGIAMFSYDGTVSWGINGDFAVMPDLDVFSETVLESFAELLAAAENAPEPEPEVESELETVPPPTGPRKRPPLGTP
ncbi:MAG: wax ester/triacylglycerol synthase family O-acyltransferase [Acidimicrobiia bacterium]